MVKQYGADAVRFTLITLASEGQDIKLAPSRFEGGRNFANKLWNTYRFLMTNAERLPVQDSGNLKSKIQNPKSLADRWIVSRLAAVIERVHDSADKYRLNDCATAIYDFVWKEYCDWYLELIKTRLTPDTPEEIRRDTLTVAVTVFETILQLLHPIMPFITEEMWQSIASSGLQSSESGPSSPKSLMVADYPKAGDFASDLDVEKEMEFIQRVIGAIRNIRSEMRVPPERLADLAVLGCTNPHRELVERNLPEIRKLAGLNSINFDATCPPQSAAAVVEEAELFLPLAGLIDLEVERKRLDKEMARLEGLIKSAETKLSNQNFVQKAPPEVITAERQKVEDCGIQLEAMRRNRGVLE